MAPGLAEGQCIVQMVNSDGRKNEISVVRLEFYKSVDFSLEKGERFRMAPPLPFYQGRGGDRWH